MTTYNPTLFETGITQFDGDGNKFINWSDAHGLDFQNDGINPNSNQYSIFFEKSNFTETIYSKIFNSDVRIKKLVNHVENDNNNESNNNTNTEESSNSTKNIQKKYSNIKLKEQKDNHNENPDDEKPIELKQKTQKKNSNIKIKEQKDTHLTTNNEKIQKKNKMAMILM